MYLRNKSLTVDSQVIKLVNQQFPEREASRVLSELDKLSQDHALSLQPINLRNTHLAILKLAKGDFNQVCNYVGSAQKDFRDVIFWASDQ